MKKLCLCLFIAILFLNSCSNMVGDLQNLRNKKGQQQTQKTVNTSDESTKPENQNDNTATTDEPSKTQDLPEEKPSEQISEQNQTTTTSENTLALYQVLHYKQNILDDEYTLYETETFISSIDEETKAKAKSYYGFVSKDFSQQIVTADSKTQIKIYYDRNTYTITLNLNGGAFPDNAATPLSITGKFETPLDIPFPEKADYIFCGWNKIGGEIPETIKKTAAYTAFWIKDSSIPQYIVSYKTKYGTPPENFIAQQGTIISSAMLPELSAIGQQFDGWYVQDAKIEGDDYTVQSNVCITAKWTQISPVYTVRHWKEALDENLEPELAEEELFVGKAGAFTNALPKEYEGFYACAVSQKTIKSDNSTVVDIYYYRKDKPDSTDHDIDIQIQNNSTVSLTSQIQNGALVVIAEQGYESYTWLIDNRQPDGITELVSANNPNVLVITDFSERLPGAYIINVVATKDDFDYSGWIIQTKE